MEVSNLFVVLMGIGTVFFGLICLILLTMAMSAVSKSLGKNDPVPSSTPAPVPTTVPAAAPGAIPDRPVLAAAIAAAIAEDLGTDISGIRIVSMKKI